MSLPILGMQRFNDTLNRLTKAKKSNTGRLKDDLMGEYWELNESNQEDAREELLAKGIELEGIVANKTSKTI